MNVLLATLAILFATAIMPRQSSAGEANSKDIRFEIDQVLSCAKSKEVDLCLNKIFGASIGYEIVDGKEIRSINFPRMKNGSLVLNGLKLDGLFNPSIVFYPKEKVYSICGPKQPVTIGRFKFGSESRCICGLNSRGEFNWRLDYHWPFLPEKLRLAIGSMSCGEKNEFSTNGLNILEKAKICGYDFPKDTEFYILESYPAFDARKNGVIDGKGGNQISVVKGKKYMSDSSAEMPCNWEPVPEDVESEQSSDSELGT